MKLNNGLIFKTSLLIILCLSAPEATFADIITLYDMGNTIVPIDEAHISMEAETVSVVPMMGGDVARCKFVMKSYSDSTITAIVGFPINRPPWYPEFKVMVNGATVPVMRTLAGAQDGNPMEHIMYYQSDHDGLDYPGFYTWNVDWKARETVIIEIEYTAGIPGGIEGIVRGRRFQYVVRTGNYWRGPIKSAVISVILRQNLFQFRGTQDRTERTTYPDVVNMESNTQNSICLTWEFKDWTPVEDIVYEVFGWAGVEGLYATYLLPQRYLGATEYYNREYIEQLTEIEFKKAEKYFPERVDTTSRDPYRFVIAEILKNEILARNDYRFYGQNFPEHKWAQYFMRYRKLDWFDYKSILSFSEAKNKMNDFERRNYEFLNEYMESIVGE